MTRELSNDLLEECLETHTQRHGGLHTLSHGHCSTCMGLNGMVGVVRGPQDQHNVSPGAPLVRTQHAAASVVSRAEWAARTGSFLTMRDLNPVGLLDTACAGRTKAAATEGGTPPANRRAHVTISGCQTLLRRVRGWEKGGATGAQCTRF